MKTAMKTLFAAAVALTMVACNDEPAESPPAASASAPTAPPPSTPEPTPPPLAADAAFQSPEAAAAAITASNVEAEATRLEREIQEELAMEDSAQ